MDLCVLIAREESGEKEIVKGQKKGKEGERKGRNDNAIH